MAEETIGNLTSSDSWTQSGRHDKEEAVAAMRAAHAEPETSGRSKGVLETEGKIERAAGWATGCGGMYFTLKKKEKKRKEVIESEC